MSAVSLPGQVRRSRPVGRSLPFVLAAMLAACCLPSQQAWSQNSSAVPRGDYFLAKSMMQDGDFQRAGAGFRSAARSGIRSTEGRWVDSICYYAMMGECMYQMGLTAPALENYENALKLFVAHQQWLTALDFPAVIQPSNRARKQVTWAVSQRRSAPGKIPNTINSLQGRFDNLRVLAQGGVYVPLQLFPIHAEEIIECTTLAIRRRNEIMGATCRFSPLTVQVLEALLRRPAPANHWSQSWISLQLGLAYVSAGKVPEAIAELQQSLMIGGQLDHNLTCIALLELGKLAFYQEQYPQAATYLVEASISAGWFEQYWIAEEALSWASRAHQVSGGKGLFAPLPEAAVWARSDSRFMEASIYVSAAENFVAEREPAKALAMLDRAATAMRRHDMARGRVAARMAYVTAVASFQRGQMESGNAALADLLNFQAQSSHWLIQVAQADALFTSGVISERGADALFAHVLREPTSADWVVQPVETLSYSLSPRGLPLEHWFQVVLQRKEYERALEISDRIRRHRFYSRLPLGGRLLALRWVLEAPEDGISPVALLQRQDLLNRYPNYRQVSERADMIQQQIRQLPDMDADAEQTIQRKEMYRQLATLSNAQEIIMQEIALQGDAAQFCFPRIRDVKQLQQAIPAGQMVLVFFQTTRATLVFALTKQKYEYWQLASTGKLQLEMKNLLRAIGNYDKNTDVKVADLKSNGWREHSSKITGMLFAGAPPTLLDNVQQLIIVPDGPLWYLPFETLIYDDELLIERTSIRYAPYLSLALGDGRHQRALPRTAFLAGAMVPGADELIAEQGSEQFQAAVKDSVRLVGELPGPSSIVAGDYERLFVMADLDDASRLPFNLPVVPLDRGKPGSNLASWLSLPWGRCQQISLPAFHTPAENSLKRGGTGEEVFLTINGLMASGARTVVLSRWRNGGKTTYDLMREFAMRLPDMAPEIAWREGVLEIMQQPLDPALEPRVNGTAEQLLTNHPWFWAGYIVSDTTLTPGQPQPVDNVADAIAPNPGRQPAAEQQNQANPAGKKVDPFGARPAAPAGKKVDPFGARPAAPAGKKVDPFGARPAAPAGKKVDPFGARPAVAPKPADPFGGKAPVPGVLPRPGQGFGVKPVAPPARPR